MYQWYWRAVQHHPPISLRLLLLSLTRCLLPCRHAAEPKRGLPGEPGPAPLPAHPQHPGLTAPAPGPVSTAWPFTIPSGPCIGWPLTPEPSMCVTGPGWAGCGIGPRPSYPPKSLGSGPRPSGWTGLTSWSGGGSSLPLAVSAAPHRPRPPPPPRSGRAKVTAAHRTLPISVLDQKNYYPQSSWREFGLGNSLCKS